MESLLELSETALYALSVEATSVCFYIMYTTRYPLFVLHEIDDKSNMSYTPKSKRKFIVHDEYSMELGSRKEGSLNGVHTYI
jgi:hypothetical protein